MYLVQAEDMQNAKDTLDRKSAPLVWFKENAVELKDEDFIRCII